MSSKVRQPKLDVPHAGVDRRRKDMGGRKYQGTTWDAQPDAPQPPPVPEKKAGER